MKVLILTTKTNHHLYFLHQLSSDRRLDLLSVFEKKSIKFNFKTEHKLDGLRNSYEYSILSKKKIEYCVELKKKGEVYIPWLKRKISFDSKKSKIILLDNIRYFVKNNFGFNIHNFVNHFYDECDIPVINNSNTNIDKKINWKQTSILKNHGLFNIGGHSHDHLSLGLLSNKQSTLQVKKSFSFFKKRINLNLKHYSYPEGRKIDYNKLVISRLKSRGIKLCPTAIEGKNNLNTGLFDLKRVLI